MKKVIELAMTEGGGSGRRNLTMREITALRTLSRDTSRVIKPADKGGATVVMDKEDYIKACESHLSDTKFYSTPPHTDDFDYAVRTRLIVGRMKRLGMISDSTEEFCSDIEGNERLFYGLPKAHKPPENWKEGIPPHPTHCQ